MSSKSIIEHENAAKARSCTLAALRLLNRRSLTDAALQQQLADDGYKEDEVAHAMQAVRQWGYINDERLGDAIVAAAIRQKKGPAWLRQQLSRRQVPHGIAKKCLHALVDDAATLACSLLSSRFTAATLAEPRTAQRAMRLLQRRGFNFETCKSALQTVRAQNGITQEGWQPTDDGP